MSGTTTTEEGWVVKFVPFASTVDSSFWVRYCREKLETIRLNEDPIPITASYGVDGPRLQLQETSLDISQSVPNERIAVSGVLMGYNTMEAFQQADKNELLRNYFCPTFLESGHNSFLLLTYADLKNHKVLYWFAVPAMMPRAGCSIRAVRQDLLSDIWTADQCQTLANNLRQLRLETGACPPYFVCTLDSCRALSPQSYETWNDDIVFGCFDPSSTTGTVQQEQSMGWPVRNLIAYLSLHLNLGGQTVKILSYRPRRLRRIVDTNENLALSDEADPSLLLHVIVPHSKDYQWDEKIDVLCYKAVGWELNARSKPGPRWVNLRPLLDSQHLAIQAADLNLKLMKWRMIPSLQVELLQSTKVLIVGAGTLGCSVARVLLGWGVRHLTFVDNGKVSYSNPVRQSLFTLEDCHDENGSGGGRPKALAAAEALHPIAADVQSNGVELSIPMPGHADSREAIQTSVKTLDKLVQDCDVVFLLTDTRESRWLPTVMAAAHDKMAINAALGLDSWLVMRHGGGLGCYFCNDVVAPENSMKNRTLDQQCTVTRPGLAPIASSMAVELMVSLLHHPLRHVAPAPPASRSNAFSPTVAQDDDTTSPLGTMPHQIRGSLVSYTMMTPTVPAFRYCTGCAPQVVEAYQQDKVELVYEVCHSNHGSYLEDLSGLTAFRMEAANAMVDLDEDDWGDEDDDNEF